MHTLHAPTLIPSQIPKGNFFNYNFYNLQLLQLTTLQITTYKSNGFIALFGFKKFGRVQGKLIRLRLWATPDKFLILFPEALLRNKIPEFALGLISFILFFMGKREGEGNKPPLVEKTKKLTSDQEQPEHGDVSVVDDNDIAKDNVVNVSEQCEPAPEGWMTTDYVSQILEMDRETVKKYAEFYRPSHPEWFHNYLNKRNRLFEHYHPDLVAKITEAVEARPERAPEGWMTKKGLTKMLKVSKVSREVIEKYADIYRPSHPEWFRTYLDSMRRLAEHYHPDLVAKITEAVEAREGYPPEGWMTNESLSKILKIERKTVKKYAEFYRPSHPEWFHNYLDKVRNISEHYHPNLVAEIKAEITKAVEARPKRAPEGWMTNESLSKILKISWRMVKNHVESYRSSSPEWFHDYLNKGNKLFEHYHPDLVAIITEEIEKIKRQRPEQTREQKNAFTSFIEEVIEGKTERGKEFREILQAFGVTEALGILFRIHPEFKDLPIEFVQSVLADYLGDTLAAPPPTGSDLFGEWKPRNEYFSTPDARSAFYETVKANCLKYYYEEKRRGNNRPSKEIIYQYLDHLLEQIGKHNISIPELDDILQEVAAYYESIFVDIDIPEHVVEQLGEEREFPDINQRINIRELRDKKRIVIGDEMGLGKSASSILAKEYLGVQCALIVAPDNVLSTWRRYLSDDREAGGYFKTGEAPRVLTVEAPKDIEKIDAESYDYILISQEKLTDRYTSALVTAGFDMIIVDEIHKLKNLEGTRHKGLMRLSETIHGDDKYLALLSGTPIPNKIKDVAVLLKLLFPDEFGRVGNDVLVQQIIFGKLIDLRAKLLPHMQLKELRDSVDMPPLTEREISFELEAFERKIYDMLLEEDELDPTKKIKFLQRFLTAPELLGITPNVENTKAAVVSRELTEAFGDHKKVVLFINHFIEGVVRGEGSVVDTLDIPDNVEVLKIHGGNAGERDLIQRRFQEESGKMLLVVSGRTADVGVDFSRAECVYFYDDPWTKYDKRQELARAYRPGLDHPLTASTFIAEGTLDRGLAVYIEKKYRAIEKVLRGIPITELEKQMIKKGEGAKEGSVDPGIEVNPEFANFFFTAQQRLEKIFARVKQMSQEQFEQFLEKYGREYADAYGILMHRSYQANGNRITGTLVERFVEERSQTPETVSILDMASGPEMLRRHISNTLQDRVVSIDMNKHHFPKEDKTHVVGSYLKTPFQDKSFDYTTMTFGWDCTEFSPKKEKYARMEVILEMNRLLRIGGRAILNLIYSLELKSPERFDSVIEQFGFRVVEESSGYIQEEEQYRSRVITLEKVADAPELDSVVKQMQEKEEDEFAVFKFIRNKKPKHRLRGVRNIMTAFTLNDTRIPIPFNKEDAEVLQEEKDILAEGKRLQEQYSSIANIPRDIVIAHNFVRVHDGRRFILFKELQKGGGVVIVYDKKPEERQRRGKRVRTKRRSE